MGGLEAMGITTRRKLLSYAVIIVVAVLETSTSFGLEFGAAQPFSIELKGGRAIMDPLQPAYLSGSPPPPNAGCSNPPPGEYCLDIVLPYTTFYLASAKLGSTTYTASQEVFVTPGSYTISVASLVTGYSFSFWGTDGGATVSSYSSSSTLITTPSANSAVFLNVYASSGFSTFSFYTQPAVSGWNFGSILVGFHYFASGTSVKLTQGWTYNLSANPVGSYTFWNWIGTAAGLGSTTTNSTTFSPGSSSGTLTLIENRTAGNWAGFAIYGSNATVTQVNASWVVPGGTCPPHTTTRFALWGGLDGALGTTVEQTGIDAICNSGTMTYDAWYEMAPSLPVPFSLTVNAGDVMNATVAYDSGTGKFTLALTDVTSGTKVSTVQSGSSPELSSAECISETLTWDPLTEPVTFSHVKFGNGYTSVPNTCYAVVSGSAKVPFSSLEYVSIQYAYSGAIYSYNSGLNLGSFELTYT